MATNEQGAEYCSIELSPAHRPDAVQCRIGVTDKAEVSQRCDTYQMFAQC
jgi:hypothetical protein